MQARNFKHKRNKVELDQHFRQNFRSSLNVQQVSNFRMSLDTRIQSPNLFRESLPTTNQINFLRFHQSHQSISKRENNILQPVKKLKEVFSLLENKISSARNNLRQPSKVNKTKQSMSQIFDNSTSMIKQKYQESTINIESSSKLLSLIKQTQYISSSNIKTYYLKEVAKGLQGKNKKALEHILLSWKVMKSLQSLQQFPEKHLSKIKVNLPLNLEDRYKKTLVLDLDETLIHCEEKYLGQESIEVKMEENGVTTTAYMLIRPYAISFLKKMSKLFEIIVFTASHRSYGEAILDEIDPEREYIKHRIFRQNCLEVYQNLFIKDLRIINRDLKNMVLVDNAPYSYIFQKQNGIPILPFFKGSDNELPALEKYLQILAKCDDVRLKNKNTFKLERYNEFDDGEQMGRQLYLSDQVTNV